MTLNERNWMGDPAAETRKKRVPESAAARAARMHGARPFPAAAAKILTLTSREEFDVSAVVKALESDAPMAARVLRVVNSAVFGLRAKVTSIRQAVTLLGSKGVREATIAGSVLNLFPGKKTAAWKALHAHATLAGALARHLADEWRIPADEMFVAAFLHDIGKWILLEEEADYEQVLESAGATFEGTLDEEHGLFGFDHAELGEHMLTAWAIPQPVPRMVGLHHDPAAALEESTDMALRVSLLRFVDRLAYAIVNDEEVDFEAFAATDHCAYLGITAKTLSDRYEALRAMHTPEEEGGSTHMRAGSFPKLRSPKVPLAGENVTGIAEPTVVHEEKCTACESSAIKRHCPRCKAALCRAHAPDRGRICDDCEFEYRQTLNENATASTSWFVIFAVCAFASFAGAAWIHGARPSFFAATTGFTFAAVMIALRRLGLRQRFMRRG